MYSGIRMQSKCLLSRLWLKNYILPSYRNHISTQFCLLKAKRTAFFRQHSHQNSAIQRLTENPYLETFNLVYNDVFDDLTYKNKSIPPLVAERLGRVLSYNVLGGKLNRGLTVVLAYNKLSTLQNEQNIKLACILGWCVELIQAFFLVSDDIMDGGEIRRGKPCWFRCKDVGLEAINDALLLETSVHHLLKTYFSQLECYIKLVNEVAESIKLTVYGQSLDMAANPSFSLPKLESFSLSYYKTIAEFKTAYYTYCLPVYFAMHLIGGFSADHYEAVKNICLKLGYLFQMQDDYLDVYGQTSITGKVGRDIKEGKCTWFSAVAFEKATKEGKGLMKEYYGVDDDLAAVKILEYYSALSMKKQYFDEEEKLTSDIKKSIDQLDSHVLNKELFKILLMNICKREK